MDECWKFWVDVGGTFTDCLATGPDGQSWRGKVLSSGRLRGTAVWQRPGQLQIAWPAGWTAAPLPDGFLAGYRCQLLDEAGTVIASAGVADYDAAQQTVTLRDPQIDPERAEHAPKASGWLGGGTVEFDWDGLAPLLAIRLCLGLNPATPLPRLALRLGTTRGTNALLTRRGARTALITTAGFADALWIGDQQRPDLFALNVSKSPPLCERAIGVSERLSATGQVLQPLDLEAARHSLAALKEDGIESLAICLLHSYLNPRHECLLEQLARPFAFANISLSHRCSPLIKFTARASTTVLDAYLNPLLQDYLLQIRGALSPESEVLLMTSSGGLVPPAEFSGKDSVLSGPAGGVVGFATVARQFGFPRAIGFDMGGTSTDVARFDGAVTLQQETRKAGVWIQSPTLAIETVAAGGGSCCHFDGQRLLVGPQSAGADPGPACYGRGGPLTITDLNLWLGRVSAEQFPFPLRPAAVDAALRQRIREIEQATGRSYSPDELAAAYLAVANSHMASAIAAVSTRQGVDPADYPLVAFGGAAAQHACGVADLLGCPQVLIHPHASLLSAYGIGHSPISRIAQRHLDWPLDDSHVGQLPSLGRELRDDARNRLPDSDVHSSNHHFRLWLQVAGTDQSLSVDYSPGRTAAILRADFWGQYAIRFGVTWDRPLRILSLEVTVENRPASQSPEAADADPSTATAGRSAGDTGLESRSFAPLGVGPQVIAMPNSSIWLEPHWRAERNSEGLIRLWRDRSISAPPERSGAAGQSSPAGSDSTIPRDPLRLELFSHRLTEIATQMGLTLQATCTSVNVKERLDFSCAVFDTDGNLLVNAPHIPVHLGAMSETVKSIIRQSGPFAAHDVWVTNDPFQGGSHLPDVTVVTPVFPSPAPSTARPPDDAAPSPCSSPQELEPVFWVASRAHHAEIGGITPGSLPPFASCLEEEGVVLRNLRWFTAPGQINPQIEFELRNATYPSRSPETNMQDLQAQVAANRVGAERLRGFLAEWGWPLVRAYCRHIQDSAAEHTQSLLKQLPVGTFSRHDQLDCGLHIHLQVTVKPDQIVFDFSGTSPPSHRNFNTNPAIVQSAVLYCLRVMIAAPIPLNQGVLRPISIVLPPCFLNPLGATAAELGPPRFADAELPAVGGGNVETSQRIVDVVLGALNVAAASQGTMNNFLFGDDSFGFYETMGGGCGATAQGDGADAVHSHMTNTRLTDPEILETRYPVRLLEFRIRTGSGGAGRQKGGNGMVRRFQFLRPLQVSLVTNRRERQAPAPFGLGGGAPGLRGLNVWELADGHRSELPASCQLQVEAGQIIEIQTPGGGGWGAPDGPAQDGPPDQD